MVLYASINKEYVNEDLRVNKEVVKRQFKHVATSSKTYTPASQLDQSMMYNFDKLFEDFRSGVESLLSANAEDELTLTKSYEIIKKYNYLMSFLKNIMKITTLSKRDSEKIEAKFTELLPNLQNLYNLATINNFVDKGEIKAMLESVQNLQFNSIDAGKKGESITTNINERNKYINMVNEVNTGLPLLIKDVEENDELKDKFANQLEQMSEFFEDEKEDIKIYLSSSKTSKLTQASRAELMNTFDHNYEIYKTIQDIVSQSKTTAKDNQEIDVINAKTDASNNSLLKSNFASLVQNNKQINTLRISINDTLTQALSPEQIKEIVKKHVDKQYNEAKKDITNEKEKQELADAADKQQEMMFYRVMKHRSDIYERFSNINNAYDRFSKIVVSEYSEYNKNGSPFDLNRAYDETVQYLEVYEEIGNNIKSISEDLYEKKPTKILTTIKKPLLQLTPQTPKKKKKNPDDVKVNEVKPNKTKDEYHEFVKQYRATHNNMGSKQATTEISNKGLWEKYKNGTYNLPTHKIKQDEQKYETPIKKDKKL
jgi:hypothetical protein